MSADHSVETLLAHLGADAAARDLLSQLWLQVRPEARAKASSPDSIARLLLDRLGDAPGGWESVRIGNARDTLLGYLGKTGLPRVSDKTPALLEASASIALVFGGQASDYLATLTRLYKPGTQAHAFLDTFAERLNELVAARPLKEQALYLHGVDFRAWLDGATPPAEYMVSAQISMPLIFAAQIAELLALLQQGYDRPAFWQKIVATSGHSQGLVPALCVNETLRKGGLEQRALDYGTFVFFMGMRVGEAFRPHPGEASHMASVRGFSTEELEAFGVHVALENTWQARVVSGRPEQLEKAKRAVHAEVESRRARKSAGRYAGRVPDGDFEFLKVGAPYHSPLLSAAADRAALDARGLQLDLAALPVAFVDGYDVVTVGDPLQWLARRVLVDRVRWTEVASEISAVGAGYVIDLGPTDTVAKLTAANMRGRGVSVIPVAALDHAKVPALPAKYESYAPVLANGRVKNKFTDATGRPPVIVPGMTPTTVEVPLVAAAANAGYVAELAGGGQVTEAILRKRLAELSRALTPGQGVVFNALYLDPYLWRLHFGERLVIRLKDEGYPLIGVTVSAGVPPKDEAVALLRELHAHGLWLNAFKPGNDQQLKDVLAIADAAPELTIFAHIEGGKAGGHHSWEDLDDLLARHYPALRERQNLVICVGGGIGTEPRAATYLNGTWSERFGLPRMPVDAVFIGTRLMACLEAKTSPQVKAALVAASGTDAWVYDGAVAGQVTSGRSQLDAAIYYMDTAAAKAGRLLDEVAGKADVVQARRAEIIAALALTAKPYFGDVETMSYAELLERFVSITAFGRGGEYEDGVWPDVSYRHRFVELVRLIEARLSVSLLADDPFAVVAALRAMPQTTVHPDDVAAFLAICRKPGKPVCFVPVIDQDVRKWFKADSLWQSHDDRFDADAVLAIPGPEAVAGITQADEPVATVLASFERALIAVAEREVSVRDGGPLERALRCADVVLADAGARVVKNPMHALFKTPELRRDANGRVIAIEAAAVRATFEDALDVRLRCGAHELPLFLSWAGDHLVWDRAAFIEAQRDFYAAVMGDASITLDRDAVAAFALATGDDTTSGDVPPLNMCFALAWPEIYRALSDARPDMLALLHEENRVDAGPAWPLRAGDPLAVTARVTRVEELPSARRLVVTAELRLPSPRSGRGTGRSEATAQREGELAATVESVFFVRLPVNPRAGVISELRSYSAQISVRDAAERDFFFSQPWVRRATDALPFDTFTIRCDRFGIEDGKWLATGDVLHEDRVVARIDLHTAAERHPLAEACKLLATRATEVALPESRELGALEIKAPSDMRLYARASGDHNPLHTDRGVAAFAGFDAPIVHGMWTASAALHRAARLAANGHGQRMTALRTRFLAPVALGDRLSVSVRQVAVDAAGPVVEIDVFALRGDARVLVLQGRATFSAPKTAYAFPGQGIQAQNMGMEGYARSAAARAVWDEADRVCREKLGFSILTVVRTNPKELTVDGVRLSHPKGALFLTQFTQVAMAVMAVAQVRELRERGVLAANARYCGHSVGEYSALAAICEALPLAAVVELVYHRGLAMNGLVTRDANGASPYAMGVIRPNHAGLDEAAALQIVERVRRESGLPLEVVNYNIRGRQYSVTGHVDALARLADTLAPLAKPTRRGGGKEKAYIDVPGIDVPFHSSLLRDGVPVFRATLERVLPREIDPALLVDRYIPNLVAEPFSLSREYVERVATVSGSDVLANVLSSWAAWQPVRLARTLLIELLAYQFASPVRWIQTQDVLFERDPVEMFVEVGVKEQPTIANMALITLSDGSFEKRPRVLNSEGELAEIVGPKAAIVQPPSPSPSPSPSLRSADPSPVPVEGRAEARIADAPYTVKDALITQLALQAKIAPAQIRDNETLDELLGGNSARRNQVLADVGAEFGIGAIDGAHEQPLSELAKAVAARASKYATHGKYLAAKIDAAIPAVFGAARVTKKDVTDYLASTWGLGAGRTLAILSRIALHGRDGDSARGGPISAVPAKGLTDRTRALAWLDDVVAAYARELAIPLQKPSAATAKVAVDSAALDALEAKMHEMFSALRNDPVSGTVVAKPEVDTAAARLALFEKEHGAAYEEAIRPIFDAKKHVAFTSAWAWVKRDVVAFAGRVFAGDLSEDETLGRRLDDGAAKALRAYRDVAEREGNAAAVQAFDRVLRSRDPIATTPRTALVTGAGPGSIACAIVERLLARGDRVIVTTSSYKPERLTFFKRLYQTHARPGAELHVVPANQGSLSDMDALVKWIVTPLTEQAGAGERRLKDAWIPDVLLPFAAMGEAADVTGIGDKSLAVVRVLLVGLERLLGAVAASYEQHAVRHRLCRVVLPLSPNHGAFGGDGVYGECKAALETLLTKHRSERERWGRYVSLVGARIGWVRGTGLMEQNDALAKAMEQRAKIRTYSNAEMAAELTRLVDGDDKEPQLVDLSGGMGEVHDLSVIAREIREALTDGARVKRRREELDAQLKTRLEKPAPAATKAERKARVQTSAPIPTTEELAALPSLDHLDLDRVVCVVGYGEVGPWGSSRTRWAMEANGTLSLEAVRELAWMTGLVKPGENGLVDAASGEAVADHELHARYEATLLQNAGIRFIDSEITGFDPNGALSYFDVHLDRDFAFPATSRQMAEEIRAADPEHTKVMVAEDGSFLVLRAKGTKVKMARALRLDRHVAGQIPKGWSAARYGLPPELVAQVDRATLFNLIATVEAFLAAGMEPEEIYRYVHPARVGSTQSAGLGSMNQLRRMYTDFYMGQARQNDTLQETLINVVSGYVVQSYLGSYGPMSFPVAACATAAVSVSDACDKILLGQADLMIAGGVDDYAVEANVGFADMGATASSDELLAMGIEPKRASRPNDRRRRGFVEAQGAGAMVVCRASLALKMGLPVYGIIAHASSHGDGVNLSVPAPGIGVLSAATESGEHDPRSACDFTKRRDAVRALEMKQRELATVLGEDEAKAIITRERRRLAHDFFRDEQAISPLRGALGVFGLSADDVALVSKHDTSTAMNDVGENRLHHWLQQKLGRTDGLPLPVISQKSLTGHSKGAAAAWQMHGVMQAMQDGVIPANASLEDVDPVMADYSTMTFTDRALTLPRARIKAALVTSLGFGHVGALVCLVHPFMFWRMLGDTDRKAYEAKVRARTSAATAKLQRVLSGKEPMFVRRTERPFAGKEGTAAHLQHEARVLMQADALREGKRYA